MKAADLDPIARANSPQFEPIFDPRPKSDTTDCCQLMNHSHPGKVLKGNENLNLNFE